MSRKIFVAGHNGMVGSALVRSLSQDEGVELITCGREELDLIDQAKVERFFNEQSIDEVYLAAAKVGGISANNEFPADFIYDNLMIQANVIHGAYTVSYTHLTLPTILLV